MARKKVTSKTLLEMAEAGETITMLTAYDYPTAKIVDKAGIDVILVGDSVANVILGYENTLPVTMDELIHHAKAVTRAAKRALIVGDMPFLSFQASPEDAVRNAGRFIKEAGTDVVKLEGGKGMLDRVEAIVRAGIPVMGHLGFTPQWLRQFGGYKVRGRSREEAKEILRDARRLEEAGAFSIVLEMVPRELARLITDELEIPTIGIGAGSDCNGQVLVLHDILGLSEFAPSFSKQYVDLSAVVEDAVKVFKEEVKSGKFPTPEHEFGMDEEDLEAVKRELDEL